MLKKPPFWIYGTCNDRPARKDKHKGNVQFVLWKKGHNGLKEDYWHDFDRSWWNMFVPDEITNTKPLYNMKLSVKVSYFVAAVFIAIGAFMIITPPNEGALVPVLVGVGIAAVATFKHLTDSPGK